MKYRYTLLDKILFAIYSLYIYWLCLALVSWNVFQYSIVNEQYAVAIVLSELLAMLCVPYYVIRSIRLLRHSKRNSSDSSNVSANCTNRLTDRMISHCVLINSGVLILCCAFSLTM